MSRAQLLELGLSGPSIQRWVASGRLHRLHRGVFAVGHRAITLEARWLAATLACGPGAVLSHGPAGQLLRILDRGERFAFHVSLPRNLDRGPAGIVTHRPRDLPDCDTTARDRIPVTTPTRTVWDLATVLPARQVRRAFERAEKYGRLDRVRLGQLLKTSPSRKGAGTIRQLLSERPLPLEETRSWLEELSLQICRDHGLPLPAINVPVLGYEVDLLWPAARFVVEADGGDHLDHSQRDKDNERDIALARAGYLVRRYSYLAMGRERAVASEVLEILAERQGLADRLGQ